MNTIINKNTKSFKEFEKNIFNIICLIGESLTSYILEKWDDEINENRDKKKYRNKGLRKTSIKTIYGEVTYRRRVYETEDGDQRTVNKRRRSVEPDPEIRAKDRRRGRRSRLTDEGKPDRGQRRKARAF